MLAWADNSGEVPKVVIYDLATTTLKRALNLDATMKLRNIRWSDDETLLLTVSLTHRIAGTPSKYRYEWFRTLALDVSGGNARMLLMDDVKSLVTSSKLHALRTPKPKTVIMSTLDYSVVKQGREIGSRLGGGRKNSGWVLCLYEVDTTTGKGRMIEQGTPFTDDWIVAADGQALARSDWDPERRELRLLRKDGMGWQEIFTHAGSGSLSIQGVSSDGTAILAVGAIDTPLAKLWAIALDGSGAKVLLEDPKYDVEGVITDTYSNLSVGAWVGGPDESVRWFDTKAESRYKSLVRAFPNRTVEIQGRSENGSRVVAKVDSHGLPGIYYVVDFSKGTADIIGEDYPALANVPLGEVKAISYRARDGMEIPAYLTIPAGGGENLPMIVLPHGGPEARDGVDFDWLAQFLASRGYLVLQPQFRGSTGFGDAFRLAGYRQWGGLMQDDVTDGVKAMIEQHRADAHRICIVGASYGGYAALAGAAFTPDLYACAVSVSGVSDLPVMLESEKQLGGEDSDSTLYWRDHIGSPLDPNVIAKSPARAAAGVRAPILLLHGVDDTVVPPIQSELMKRALDKAGKPNTYIKLPQEDHWLSRSATRIQVLTEVEKFVAAPLAGAK
jgi:dipeptidyl aminopeptidase/acylaminoacyl peptidase